jgi:septum formation protein
MNIILASSSIHRLEILQKANIYPNQIIAPDIDETPQKKEDFLELVKRLAEEKCAKVAKDITNGIVISADTIVVCKGRILDKAITSDDVSSHLKLLSGSRAKIITALSVIVKEDNSLKACKTKISKSIVKFKVLSYQEMSEYIASNEGIGKAGGFSIDGCATHFIKSLSGSVSGIIGMPLYELSLILKSINYDHKIKSKS